MSRAEIQLDDGSVIQGRLYPIPDDLVGPARVFVAGFRAQLTTEGQNLDPNGYLIAFDSAGTGIARRRSI